VASELERFDLPEHVRKAIEKSLEDLARRDFWLDIQKLTNESLGNILKVGIEEGLNGEQLAKRINQALGGQAKWRARAIARTETTNLYNSGHEAVFQTLGEDDLIIGKQWMTIIDDRTRPSHAKIDGEIVKPNEDFSIGAPYPGHPSLDAADRVNCRCTVISVFKDE
jgi:SPP1 gp7 family putative phage head morphogenesis protein